MKLGGMEDETLLRVNPEAHQLTGFIGCIRGFKIGDTVYDLQANATNPVGKNTGHARPRRLTAMPSLTLCPVHPADQISPAHPA